MRFLAIAILMGFLAPCTGTAQTPQKDSGQNTAQPATGAPASGGIETEKVNIPLRMQAPPRSMANQPGYMEPAQTHALLIKIWQREFRVQDLLTQVRPQKLKMPPAVLASFNNNLGRLRRNLDTLEKSRQQFSGRVDSEYLGFQTYAGISAVLPPLDQLALLVSRYGNRSLSAEFNQAWNEMLIMQQSLKPYLDFMLRNHDQIFLIMENNLYGCQNELNYAMRGANGRAAPMRNVLPNFKGRRHRPRKAAAGDKANSKK